MKEPKRERTLYEIASIFFAQVVILFAAVGMLAVGLGDEGPLSSGFWVCAGFLLLGLGRLYLGLRRGNEGLKTEGLAEIRLAEREPDDQSKNKRDE